MNQEENNIHQIDTACISLQVFCDYVKDNHYDENMFNADGTLNINYNNHKKTGLIAQIFEDWYPEFYAKYKDAVDKYRPNAPKEIQKMIDCHNKNLGGSVYECPECHQFTFVGHTCKSRFCTSCGYKYKMNRVESILETAYRCKHRQIVFTMPEELWPYYFFDYENMMNILFDAVNKTIYSVLNYTYKKTKKGWKMYKNKKQFKPGFFAFLHTFGRDIAKWNPHIHILIAEIKMGGIHIYENWNYFNYDSLSKRFQRILLDDMLEYLGNSFRSMYGKMWQKYQKGFYVYAEPKEFPNLQAGIEYVTRYCGRPAISENRIINYDGTNVTYCFNDHKDNEYHEKTVTAIEFIGMLVRHLVPENFKTIRRYGFYCKKDENHDKMVKLVPEESHKLRKQFMTYVMSILKSFNRHPLSCPKCGTIMTYAFEILPGGG